MLNEKKICLLVFYRKAGKYALNVIAGALGTNSVTKDIPIVYAKRQSDLLEEIYLCHRNNQYPVVAWSFYSPGFAESAALLQQVKKNTPAHIAVFHLAGGVHCTAQPQQVLEAGFDGVAVGEGEQIIVDFMSNLKQNRDWRDTKGISHLCDGHYIYNGRGDVINLNNYPPFFAREKRVQPIEITRGCIFACRFCQTPHVNKARFRHRTIENIGRYIDIMLERDMRDFRFITPTSLSYGSEDESVNLPKIEELLTMVRKKIGAERRLFYGTFPSEVRPEHVSVEALRVLKRYVDNDNLIIGGQSGSDTVLDAIRRGHGVQDVRNAVELCVREGFIPNVDILFGLPGETEHDILLTRQFVEELSAMGARIHSHTFMPLPGTPLVDASAGTVDEKTSAVITRLESQGAAWGSWRQQEKVAEQLVILRSKH